MKRNIIIAVAFMISFPLFGGLSRKITTRRNDGQIIKRAIEALEDSVTYLDKDQTFSETLTFTAEDGAIVVNDSAFVDTLGVGGLLDLTGVLDVDGVSNLDNTDIDGTLTMDGTAFDVNSTTTVTIDNTNAGNGVVINAATSGGVVSIGHTTSETTVNDNLNVTGDMDVDGVANLDNTDIDGTLTADGTVFSLDATTSFNLDNTNASNGISINTATSAGVVSIGHTTSETTVNDNLTVTGSLTGNGGIVLGTATYGILMEGTYTNAIRIIQSVSASAATSVRVLNTYTGATGYHTAVMGAAIYDPTAATGYGAVIGVYGEANIQGEFTGGTNWSYGVRGTLQLTNATVINDGSSIFGAINASLKDDATPTLTAGHIVGLYIENLVDADLSGINGITAMIYSANNASATCTMDYGWYNYGPKVTYLLGIYDGTVSGCVDATTPAGDDTPSGRIKIDVDGADRYLYFYD